MPETENNENNKAEEMTAKQAKPEKADQVYELSYLLVPTISEENTPAVFGNLKELVVSTGGEVISSEMPRMTHLAYIMTKVIDNIRNKFDSAYFGWIKFEMEASKIADLKKQLDLSPDLIRFLIIKTIRENTIAPKRFAGSSPSRFKASDRKEEKKDVTPIDKAEIDKEIDALAEAAA